MANNFESEEAAAAIFENNFGSTTTTTTGRPSAKNMENAQLRRAMAESLDSRFAVRPPSSSAVVNRGRVLHPTLLPQKPYPQWLLNEIRNSTPTARARVPVPGPRPNYMKRTRNYVETRRPMHGVYSPEDQQAAEKEFRELESQADHELLQNFTRRGLIPGSIEYNPAAVATNGERAELSRLGYGAEAAGGGGAAAAGGFGGFGGGSSTTTTAGGGAASGVRSRLDTVAQEMGIPSAQLSRGLKRANMTLEELLKFSEGNMATAKAALEIARRNTRRRRTTSRKGKRRTHS
jgi:hypothetical protein